MFTLYPTIPALSSPDFRPRTFRYAQGFSCKHTRTRPFPTSAKDVALFTQTLFENASAREFHGGPGTNPRNREGGWDHTLGRVRCPNCTGLGYLGKGYLLYPPVMSTTPRASLPRPTNSIPNKEKTKRASSSEYESEESSSEDSRVSEVCLSDSS